MKHSNYSFSFIIPVYNTDSMLLRRCINSIENQNLSNYEIIIVNDGSNEPCLLKYLRELSIVNNKIHVYDQKNQGSAAARNVALEVAKGDYVFFVDADDILAESLFTDVTEDDLKTDILCMDYTIDGSSGGSLGKKIDFSKKKDTIYMNVLYYPGVLEELMFGALWAKCFSRSFLEQYKIRFQPELRKTQDRAFMLDAYYYANRILYVPVQSYNYTSNATSITHRMNMNMTNYCSAVVDAVKKSCEEKKIPTAYSRFFVYSIVYEMLRLTLLNNEYKGNYFEYHKKMNEIYKKFGIEQELKSLKIIDFKTVKGRAKYIMLKYHMYGALRIYFTFK